MITTQPIGILSQGVLRAEAARRLRSARPDLADRYDLHDPVHLRAAYQTAAAGDALSAVVVLRRFDPAAWLAGTCAFAFGLDPELAARWRAGLTRTVFLSGNPRNLVHRFGFDHIAADESMAWLAPAPPAATMALRRLLTGFDGAVELLSSPSLSVVVPGRARTGRRYDAYLATAGMRLIDGLIALNHLLAEAISDGVLLPGDRLSLHRTPSLAGMPGPFTAIRVLPDADDPGRLRAQACLTGPVVAELGYGENP
ncbi:MULTISPECIES: DUF6182 family protein [unclassified Nocardia]|uniref:DUF6182 family protein n=1 Tax=unclassified Nocardia TaxID=2637762 RepID=UPI001CE461B7|nr:MULTISPECIES: DUF6182 family protein [unclassified Nocardia]